MFYFGYYQSYDDFKKKQIFIYYLEYILYL